MVSLIVVDNVVEHYRLISFNITMIKKIQCLNTIFEFPISILEFLISNKNVRGRGVSEITTIRHVQSHIKTGRSNNYKFLEQENQRI